MTADPGVFEKLAVLDELKRHRQHMQMLPCTHTHTRPFKRFCLHFKILLVIFIFRHGCANTKKNPKTGELPSAPFVRLRSRVRVL